ncbi:MAG: ribosome silencing factor [Chlorobi bacterium]|nr:ribosome silencing factor [Chlorobiota bacterium]
MELRKLSDLPEPIRIVLGAILDKKGIEPVVIDMRGGDTPADFFVIVTGDADPHIKTLLEEVETQLKRQVGAIPFVKEGTDTRRWAVLDYLDYVVHVMLPEAREYYNLEGLWSDYPIYSIDEAGNLSNTNESTHDQIATENSDE